MSEPLDLELATTAILADNHDVKLLVKMLSGQLASALGDRVKVVRAGGLLRRSDDVKALEVSLGPKLYAAQVAGPALECTIGHSSGGIVIRTDRVGMDEWLGRLLGDLQAEAATNQASKSALENIVLGGGRL